MDKRLNYRNLLENWMQYYKLTAEAAKKMFASIWIRVQVSKEVSDDKGADQNAENME
ncbi:MAG: hypothetical protein J1E00_01905 [Oscillospiraceae bacterium]|nr:hypothetical protein [Oscillospiraceae bacterium]